MTTGVDPPPSMMSRAIALLSAFPEGVDAAGVSQLARATGQPKATVHRLAGKLVELGLLEAVGNRYRLGLRLFELGHRAVRHERLRACALPVMIELRELGRQTVHLAVLDVPEVVYLDILPGPAGLELPSRVGGRMPAHATGVGRAILSRAPEAIVRAALESATARPTPRTVVAPGLLRAGLQHAARRGYAVDVEQSARGLVCVASPIVAGDEVVAALSVSGRSTTLSVPRLAPAVVEGAARVGRQMDSTS